MSEEIGQEDRAGRRPVTHGWTVELKEYFQRQHDDLIERLRERYEAQQKAIETALATAERAVDKQNAQLRDEFHEHLVQYRHEVQVAFESSDRAIQKAEAAAEKRFDSVNEFRGQLSDQVRTFLPRQEYDSAHEALISRVDADGLRLEALIKASHDRNADRIEELQKRLDTTEGKTKGIGTAWAVGVGLVGLLLAILGIVSFFNGAS